MQLLKKTNILLMLTFCTTLSVHAKMPKAKLSYADYQPERDEMSFKNVSAKHEEPYRRITSIDPQGYMLELDTGAVFRIAEGSTQAVANWHLLDAVIIYPISWSCCSTTTYYIENTRTGSTADADLALGPRLNDENNTWILDGNFETAELYLTNPANKESYWQVDRDDLEEFSKWELGQNVIIGSNNTFYAQFFSSCKCILINVERNQYIRARLIY
ncbi:MAG: hypothetical protein S4CHLAM102_00890 [Chlamydiia bacterium]|nr:hypothetical protein [Chlamydiia bacterium]